MKSISLLSLLIWSSSTLAAFTTDLSVSKVYNSKKNQYATGSDKVVTCDQFKGTYQGNTIVVTPRAQGGSGRYSHKLVWQISESYQTFDLKRVQKEATVENGKSLSIKIPELKDDVPFLQQSIFLITKDLKTGLRATNQIVFNVSRPVILAHTNNPEKIEKGCYQVYPAYESISGILSNGSTNPSQLMIRHGIQSIWTKTNGSQWGYYISPLAWTVIGNVASFYQQYFKQFSRQTVETVEVSNGYSVSPGDFIQLYEQRTRYVQAFDVFEISACGQSTEVDGTYFMQWWGRAFHAVPVNPYDDVPAPRDTIGVAPTNNCPEELTPDFGNENLDYIFTGMN